MMEDGSLHFAVEVVGLLGVPLELLEKIIHFSIRVRSIKRALRLRLVNRRLRDLIERGMFRTRLLDEYVGTIRDEMLFDYPWRFNRNRPGGRDSAWLSFIKKYLAYRVFFQPNLDPQCPESLVHRAACFLGQVHGDNSEGAMLRYITTLCHVGFWEHCRNNNRYSEENRCIGSKFVDDTCNYIDSTSNNNASYDGDRPLKNILLEAAIYLGDIELTKKVYAMEPQSGYRFDPEDDETTDDAIISDDRLRLAAIYGGLEMFRLVNKIELGVETTEQYRKRYSNDNLMDGILDVSKDGGDAALIHFLLDLGIPWDMYTVTYWSRYTRPLAMIYAPSPDIFKRLAAIEGAGTSALKAAPVKLCCRRDGMVMRLNHSAAANNVVMLQYLLDQGGGPYLNNTHRCFLRKSEPSDESWQQWLLNPLSRAVEVGNVEMVELMLAHGADPNYCKVGTPLMAAVRRNNLKIARVLIDHGADVNLGSPPPVVLAIRAENSAMFELLMRSRTVINTPETGGWAMALVEEEGLETMGDVLVSKGVEVGSLWHHVQSQEEFVLSPHYSMSHGH